MAGTPCERYVRLVLFLQLVCLFAASPARVAAQELGADRALIDAFIRQEMEAGNVPGLAVGIVRGDRVVYLEGFGTAGPGRGEVTPQTPFLLGSVSKSITGLAVMQLAERGRLRLDDPVQSVLPWFAMGGPDAASIRIVHLLNHTSGIPAWHGHDSGIERGGSLEERVRLKHVPRLDAAPGTRFEYSSLNYDVLGLIIEAVTGRTYQAYVETEIFRPLDMTRSAATLRAAGDAGLAVGYRPWFGFRRPTAIDYPPSAAPSGYVASTAEDMTHFLIAFLDGGRYGELSVLSETGIAAAQEAIGPTPYGAGWFSGSYYKWHTGELANYNAYITTVPSHGLGIVTLANTNDIGVKFLNPASSSLRRIPEGIRALLVGGTLPDAPTLGARATVRLVNLAVVLVVSLVSAFVIGWYLPRLRADANGRPTLAATAVLLVVPAAVLTAVPAWVQGSWRALAVSVPDLTLSVLFVSFVLLVSGLAGVVAIVHGARTARHA